MIGNHIDVIILAAGASSRMGGVKKEYQKLSNGYTVLGNSVRAFVSVPAIKTIIIAIPEDGETHARHALPQEYISAQGPQILFVKGGTTRRASAYNALTLLSSLNPDVSENSYVLIHDGARPWVSAGLIEKLLEAVKKYGAVIPFLPVTETPKELTQGEQGEIFIERHLKRANAGLAQTPQCFKFAEILRAHEEADKVNEEFTDDAEIWGRFIGKVACISGEAENRKITFKEDLI